MTKEFLDKANKLDRKIESLKYGIEQLDAFPNELARSVPNLQERWVTGNESWKLGLTTEDFQPLVEKKKTELTLALLSAIKEFEELGSNESQNDENAIACNNIHDDPSRAEFLVQFLDHQHEEVATRAVCRECIKDLPLTARLFKLDKYHLVKRS